VVAPTGFDGQASTLVCLVVFHLLPAYQKPIWFTWDRSPMKMLPGVKNQIALFCGNVQWFADEGNGQDTPSGRASCGVGSRGGRCLSMGDYVMGTGITRGAPAAGGG
jgi:hypothetical protein